MVNHEIDRDRRLIFSDRPHPHHRRAQRRQVNQRRNAGEVLQNNPRRLEGHFDHLVCNRHPLGKIHHVIVSDFKAVVIAERRLKQDFDRKRERR